MNDSLFSDLDKNNIPNIDLMHHEDKVSFAIRTTEYIYDKTEGKPDIPHRHNYYTIIWTKKACGIHNIDYREYKIEPNIVFFVSPGQVHQVIMNIRPEGMVIMFTREFLVKNDINIEFLTNLGLFYDHPEMPPLRVNHSVADKLDSMGREMKKIYDSDDNYKEEAIGAWLKLFLITCNKISDENTNTNTQLHQSGKQILTDFKALVEEKFMLWHKVSEYAHQLSISADYLNNVVKSNIGITAKDFIQKRLILEAKRLGLHTGMSLKEIAYKLGFDDPSHFSKFYKNIEGESFSDFRKTLISTMTD